MIYCASGRSPPPDPERPKIRVASSSDETTRRSFLSPAALLSSSTPIGLFCCRICNRTAFLRDGFTMDDPASRIPAQLVSPWELDSRTWPAKLIGRMV